MFIKELTLNNFRKFENQSFHFNPRFTVLVGQNATGKTQVLDAISIILGIYITKITRRTQTMRAIKEAEVRLVDKVFNSDQQVPDQQIRREAQYPVQIQGEVKYGDTDYTVICQKNSKTGRTSFGQSRKFSVQASKDADQITKGAEITLPLITYYGSGRLWPLKRHIKDVSLAKSRAAAYVDALDPNTDLKEFQGWLKRLEMVALQRNQKQTALELTRRVLAGMIPDCRNVYYDFASDYISLDFYNQSSCPFFNLSDGFRCMVSMVTDIIRRITMLNPHLGENALEQTSGIVLIDELDLHLHPIWQREVVDDLKRFFPQIQFITTTHSPFIIQSLDEGEVIDLEACGRDSFLPEDGSAQPAPARAYVKRSIEDIVEEIMGIEVPQRSQRYNKMYQAAIEYYQLLSGVRGATEKEKQAIKEKLDDLSAPFSNDVAYCAFLKMKELLAFHGKE